MDWTAHLDNYCERTDPGFWAEPLNAATNLSFLVAAFVMWSLLGGKRDPEARALTLILLAVGVGSFLFHTFATRWALLADVLPITAFILVYIYAATRRFFGASLWVGLVAVAAFFPFSWAVTAAVGAVVGPLNGSLGYVPVPVLVLLYASALGPRDPVTARGLVIGAGILVVSLFFRTVDAGVCGWLPIGTHFLWHTLNGIMLGWMIWVLHSHRGTVV